MINLKNKKILIVDDAQDILNLLKTLLVKNGFRNILTVKNGEDAIKLCRKERPNIIILDIMLPDMDGYEVCRKIRNFSNIPILFLSAKSDEFDRLTSFSVGGDDYVAKPFSPQEVLYRILALLNRVETQNVNKDRIEIGDLGIFPKECLVLKRGHEIKLMPKVYKLLICFVENMNVVLSASDLIEKLMDIDNSDTESSITSLVCRLRREIEDDPSNPQYIITVSKIGYKFVSK